MKYISILLAIFISIAGIGCTTAAKKQQKAVAVGVYQVNQSLRQGRVDLAKKYSDELVRIVAPPKKATVVKSIETKNANGTLSQYVVLPQEYKDKEVVALDTPKFEEIVAKSPEIKKQLVEEDKAVKKFEETVDNSMRATEKSAAKGDAASKFHWLSWLMSGLGITTIIGVIVLCIFFPVLTPVFLGIFRAGMSFVSGAIGAITSLFTKKPPI